MWEREDRKGMELPPGKELECLRLYLMGDSGQSLKDQNADRNVASKDQTQRVLLRRTVLHRLLDLR